ncbi:MAG: hypothetical protein K8F91_08045, partial [Candidatus Obscuribacterales bacterium]|nr:hypothetical protein [Candidatus Obscuribacterales bacterium]
GKSAFIPLEQFQGRARPTSDIYALGATLYFLATGRDPVPFSTSDAKSSGALISIEFNDLIKAATAVKSERRIATAGEWLERLDKIIARGVW